MPQRAQSRSHLTAFRGLVLILGAIMAIAAVAASTGDSRAPQGTDFTPHATQPGLTFGIEASDNCAQCHAGGGSAADDRLLPFDSWKGNMMANATRDPIFWAALDVANSDVPGIGDYCLRCHAPSAWLRGSVVKTPSGVTQPGFNGCALEGDHDDLDFDTNDYSGVGCHMCHRTMQTSSAGQTTRLENANLWIDDSEVCETTGAFGPCRRGPYTYPEAGIGSPPHGWQYSPDFQRSELCANCHNVTSPLLGSTDATALQKLILNDGTVTGIPFPIERTYSEWKQSDYGSRIFADGFARTEPSSAPLRRFGETCQSCHMRSSTDPAARACVANDPGSRTGNLPVHEMAGANAWVPMLIRDLYGSVLGRTEAFNRTIALAEEMLQERSATLAVTLDPLGGGAQTFTARVRVTNLAGHKLPTGYAEGRRMWLNVVARDAGNNVVYESGAYNAATGVLTRDAQARVYEVQHGEWNGVEGECVITDAQGRQQFHFVKGNCILKDNRIPPLGFRGGNDLETRPVGQVYPETAPGSGMLVNYDDVLYAIPVLAGAARPIRVTATLRHQIASREYIEFLRDEAARVSIPDENTMCAAPPINRPPLATGPRTQRRGDFLYDLWQNNGRSPPVDMETATATSMAP